jgi:hypothetical protein
MVALLPMDLFDKLDRDHCSVDDFLTKDEKVQLMKKEWDLFRTTQAARMSALSTSLTLLPQSDLQVPDLRRR